MYLKNKDIDAIIETFKTTEHEIRKVLKESKTDRNNTFFTEELYERIVYLYKKGNVQSSICNDLLVSEMGIKRALQKYKVPKRSISECNIKYKRNRHYFDTIDVPNKAYILGLIYADGNNFTNHNSLTISLQENDLPLLEMIKNELEYEGPIRFIPKHDKNPNHKNAYVININDEIISAQLLKLGVVNAKSLIIKFPDFLREDLLRHFVRGYFDGDGCIYYYNKYDKCQTQTVGTKDFCETLSSILNKTLNCKNSLKHPKQCNENTYILQTGGNKSSYTFLSWLYDDAEMKMPRKYQKYLDFCEKYKMKSQVA